MTREDKQLLLKDLCARVPYNVWIGDECGNKWKLVGIDISTTDAIFKQIDDNFGIAPIETIKPYLRPMSSMTEEELNECVCQSGIKDIECPNWQDIPKEKQFEARLNHAIAVFFTDSNNVDWLNAHHFDFRNLISKGLAIDCTNLNIY